MKNYYIYLGTQTQKGSKGIYGLIMDERGQMLTKPKLLAEQPSPAAFYVNEDRSFLYAVSDADPGAIYTYRIEPETYMLTAQGSREAAGKGLCHITMDQAERYAVVTGYDDATLQVYPLDENRRLTEMFCLRRHIGQGPVVKWQASAHPACTVFSPDGAYVISCDLGMDKLLLYTMNYESGKLHRAIGKNVTMPEGSGPCRLVFSPDGRFVYVVCALSAEVITLAYQKEAGLSLLERTSALSPEFSSDRTYTSDVHITRGGRDLYVSNRGEDTVAHFRVDPQSGHIELRKSYSTHGWYPKEFLLTHDEQFLIAANLLSENLAIFRRDAATGALTLTQEVSTVNAPSALLEVYKER